LCLFMELFLILLLFLPIEVFLAAPGVYPDELCNAMSL
jgi:hypothetical protein